MFSLDVGRYSAPAMTFSHTVLLFTPESQMIADCNVVLRHPGTGRVVVQGKNGTLEVVQAWQVCPKDAD